MITIGGPQSVTRVARDLKANPARDLIEKSHPVWKVGDPLPGE